MKSKKPLKIKKPKALLLFSGGLDSILALKLLQEQNLNVESVFFLLPFSKQKIPKLKIKLHIIDCTKPPFFQQYLKIIQNPKHGYGTSLNPCKDCKIFLLKQAKKLAKKINADIIATGEVLSQRPMSQLKHQLELIEKQAGLKNKILRPLSAKLLPLTIYEKKELINRNKLLDIKGRNRKTQIQLAKNYNIKYPSPGGGCLLCEKQYTPKLKDIFKNKPLNKIKFQEIQLLNMGRHFRSDKTKQKIILGKDHEENLKLEQLNKILKYNLLISTTPGPTALFENKKDLKLTQELIKVYSKDSNEKDKKKFDGLKVN